MTEQDVAGRVSVTMAPAGGDLARLHALSDRVPKPVPSFAGLAGLSDWLLAATTLLSEKPAAGKATEWLVDNTYIVERTVAQIRHDMPRGYYSLLPALETDDGTLPPRVHSLANGIVHATNMQLTTESVISFVSAYEEAETLELAELWALATMLRLSCIESLVSAVGRLAPELTAPFEVSADEHPPSGLDANERVARSIRGLTTLSSLSWLDVVEATSAIDAVLRNDPATAYSAMDPQTRDRYRRSVEDLARRSHHEEPDVARRAVALARQNPDGARERHVGFWLIGDGRVRLERALGYRPAWRDRVRRGLRNHATGSYLTAFVLLTALLALVPGLYGLREGAEPAIVIATLAVLVLPASMLAITTLHWILSRVLPPTVLPKLDYGRGIPPAFKTAVAIPALLANRREVEHLLGQIERHRLSNVDPNLCFVLLAGFPDADQPQLPEDSALLEQAAAGIAELNRRHDPDGPGPFHLLHRERRFNPSEERWMGWERKRGKLDEFNRLLLGDPETTYTFHEGDRSTFDAVRFVITLDADTVLPHGTAARLVGTLAHPLNRPDVDEVSGRVRAGYTVVQPRVETLPQSASRSLFTRLYSGDTSIDIYSRAVSDAYQDLFGTGIYVGKAIYDVTAFSKSLEGRAPENAINSHDLFEGIHGRAALATDIVLYEDYPPSYVAFVRRLHRWVRGDWQLVPWLRRLVPGADHDYLPNRFTVIDRWKIVDNLRRSLLAPALLLLFVSAWTWLPGDPLVWTLFAALVPAGDLCIHFATGLVRERWRPSPDLSRSLAEDLGRWLLYLAFLPHQAAVAVDAIVRSLIRVILTKRHLLEWTTSAQTAAMTAQRKTAALFWSEMAVAPVAALATTAALLHWRPAALPSALPVVALWAVSPEIARRISKPILPDREQLGRQDVAFLRDLARRTWAFFESFVGPDDHWLPPDNYQEDPNDVVAHRTSPTNVGMLMLSTIAAHDLGYLGSEQLIVRLHNTLATIERLEHYRGHLLNWYDTRTLEPLAPRYVSTVDSGNLGAALLTAKEGLSELADAPLLRTERWLGLADTVSLLREGLGDLRFDGELSSTEIAERVARMHELALAQVEPAAWIRTLEAIEGLCFEIETLLLDVVADHRDSIDLGALRDSRLWLGRVHEQIHGIRRDVERLTPWLSVLETIPEQSATDSARLGPKRVRADVVELLHPGISLAEVASRCERAVAVLAEAGANDQTSTTARWLAELEKAVMAGRETSRQLLEEIRGLAARLEREALGMDFGLLYDPQVRHFYIGYNLTADQMDGHHYDLLASEARLASLVAIAKGDVPSEHWYSLERPVTRVGGAVALLSWGGTMFEYLMPPLFVHSQSSSLLGLSEREAVREQVADGNRRGLPWGVSESGFAAFDADHNYQYRTFGVQSLGRKQGLDADRVIAPYATAIALPLFPATAVQNLRRLRDLGMLTTFGFYEAIDFTPSRLAEGRDHAIVSSHMSHHQGMILAAVGNLLCDDALVRRFEQDARIRASTLLLYERIPSQPTIEEPRRQLPAVKHRSEAKTALVPWRPDPVGARPSLHVLGNGRLASCVTESGGGGIRWREHAVTRYVPGGNRHDQGLWIHVRDEEDGSTWSVGRRPAGGDGDEVDVVFHAHMIELHRRQNGVALRTDIVVGAGDDLEIRRVTVVNETDRERSLTLTSCGEVVLAPSRDDAQHPAFSKLFVEGTFVPSFDGLVFTRRARSPDQAFPVMMHRLVADSSSVALTGFEIDRERFLGRTGTTRHPQGLDRALTGRQGASLDPIMALRATVNLAPFATEQLAFATIVGPSRRSVEATAARYETLTSLEWLVSDAHTEAEREAGRLGLEADRLPELQALLSAMHSPRGELRATLDERNRNRLGQQDLWALGISGDDPILLVEKGDIGQRTVLADLLRAHAMWRRRGIAIDLVVMSEMATGYQDDASGQLNRLLEDFGLAPWLGRRAGIHLVRTDQVSDLHRQLLTVSATAIIDGANGSLGDQLTARTRLTIRPLPRLDPTVPTADPDPSPILERPRDLLFDNGVGGFSPDGRDYVIHLDADQTTPAPWCNVLANDEFGCLVTERGGGYTWAGNSGEFRLTPWTNDPVLDPAGESVYLRDEETVEVWSPTPGPARSGRPCQIRHGAGYSEWRTSVNGIESCMRVFVPTNDPVKIVELRLRNHETRHRRLTATYSAQLVLGRAPETSSAHVVVDYDAPTRTLRARSRWNAEFADAVAFLTTDRAPHGLTSDRPEFLGDDGDPEAPAAMKRVGLGGMRSGGVDPCACLQVHLDLNPNEEVRTHFVFGAGRDDEHVEMLAGRWQDPSNVDAASKQLAAHWDSLLSAITVQTPEPAMDLLINRWALYQVLSSRVLARTGFYQSSGAFGFRDQLQDVLALLHSDPARTRAHILASAGRQFVEGDVLHWWHPPLGRGVRTRCSDDLFWLPYATARYVEATADLSILDEQVPFLTAPQLGPDEHERYSRFEHGIEVASLFEHCRRALEHGLTSGAHGLPLIGDGDWNDGMNRVGADGRGESVWLGWFAGTVAADFARLCDRRGETDEAHRWRRRAEATLAAASSEAWDGRWYRRAFDDEGKPWGSATSDECQIDSIAQSWAVLSGGAPRERAEQALRSAESILVREQDRLACLLWPPFDLTARDPGYIKAYPPGIRENGGQYSHAAAWLGWAFAELGDGDGATRIFRILNPIERVRSNEAMQRYRVEPYAIAADIGSVEPHVGRGGWTWYTGAAAWTWRLGVEAILGLRRRGDHLQVTPRLPRLWTGYQATVRTDGGILDITVSTGRGPGGTAEILVDGSPIEGDLVELPTDGGTRRVDVYQGVA